MKNALRLVALLITAPAIAAPDAALPDVVGAADLSGLRDVELDIGALMQFRYTASVAPDSPDPIDDPAIGFSFRRLRTWVDFEAFDGDLRLFIQGDAGSGGNSRIDEAFGGHKIDDNWSVRWGLIRVAFNREMWVSSKRQIAVDRGSLANNLNPGRSDKIHGVELAYEAEPWRFFFTAGEGLDSRWTSFNQAGKSQWSLTLRGETLLVGDNFKQFKQYTAPSGTARGLMLGAAAHVQHTPMGGDRFAWTADLNYQDSGFNAMIMGGGHVAEDRNTLAVGEPESLFGVA
ncbi:MAG: hypothetical protein K8E66_09220, partial [Phycisphaerales bacterium]|nr:hypothetical protein [Phycisphaerales bacterium]